MSTNKYFNLYKQTSEQRLIDDLIIEAIKIHGIDVYYLPREMQREDLILNEDVISKFNDYYVMEMYIKTSDGFSGDQEVLKKFGLEIKEQLVLSIARSRFNKIVNGELVRPREGDLIFLDLPMNRQLYEIKFVDHESVFYQAGQLYVYDLKLELFSYSEETFETGIETLDELAQENDFKLQLNFASSAGTFLEDEKIFQGSTLETATAIATIDKVNSSSVYIVRDIIGKFDSGLATKSETSNLTKTLNAYDEMQDVASQYDKNSELEDEADSNILDFTEKNKITGEDI